MDYHIPKDILVFIIDSDSACYLFHSSTYIHQSLRFVCVTGYYYQPVIGKKVASLKAFLCKEINLLIGTTD